MSRALILMYHSVDEPRSPVESRYCVRPNAFRAQMAEILRLGYQPIGVSDLASSIRDGRPPPTPSVAITFDDGFECFARNGLPVLEALHIPATVFAVAGLLGGTNTWMQERGWPARRLLNAGELREVQRQGVTVGCHSLSHVPLTQISEASLAAETLQAREVLSDALGSDVTLFAYPHGAQTERERQAVAVAGYLAACSTRSGFNGPGEDLFALRRIDIYGSDGVAAFRRKLQFGANRVGYRDLGRYYLHRFAARLHG